MTEAREKRVILITGDGKGKTTAALGLALRAVGHGMRVQLLHFIKKQETGETRALALLPGVTTRHCGMGFVTSRSDPRFANHVQAARKGLALAEAALNDPAPAMVVLDEVCGAVALGLLSLEAVCRAVNRAAPGKVVVLTGRDAAPELMALADTVSRITAIKHAFDAGRPAQAGVEF